MADNKDLAAAYQTILVLWAALLMSQIVFLVVAFLAKPELMGLDLNKSFFAPGAAITIAFVVLAIGLIVASFVVKKKFFEKAVTEQKVEYVMKGTIFAAALSEGSSLLGMFLAVVFGHPYFYLWIAAGFVAILLHFPKRDDVFASGFKKP